MKIFYPENLAHPGVRTGYGPVADTNRKEKRPSAFFPLSPSYGHYIGLRIASDIAMEVTLYFNTLIHWTRFKRAKHLLRGNWT